MHAPAGETGEKNPNFGKSFAKVAGPGAKVEIKSLTRLKRNSHLGQAATLVDNATTKSFWLARGMPELAWSATTACGAPPDDE